MKKKIFNEVDNQLQVVQNSNNENYNKIVSQYFSEQDTPTKSQRPTRQSTWLKKLIPAFSCVAIAIVCLVLVFSLMTPKYSPDNVIAETATKNEFINYCASTSIDLSSTGDYEISRWYDKQSGDTLKYVVEYRSAKNQLWGSVDISSNKKYNLALSGTQDLSTKIVNDTQVTYIVNYEKSSYTLTAQAYFEYKGQKVLIYFVCQATSTTNLPTEQTFWEFFDSLITFK